MLMVQELLYSFLQALTIRLLTIVSENNIRAFLYPLNSLIKRYKAIIKDIKGVNPL
jgi:hypothetical protein